MQAFARLFDRIDQTTSTKRKLRAMAEYFAQAPAEDAAWAVFFLSGRRLRGLPGSARLRPWLIEATGLGAELVEASYAHVGDLAETVSLLMDSDAGHSDTPQLHQWVDNTLLPLREMDEAQQKRVVMDFWQRFDPATCFLATKLITGGLRVGVSRRLVVRALAETLNQDPAVLTHRMMGPWAPSAEWFRQLSEESDPEENRSRPYPFYLASPLEHNADELGPAEDWLAEFKWDGIRAQLIKRRGEVYLWSRGEERMDGRFPEVEAAAEHLPDNRVLDGELMAWQDDQPLPFHRLQTRINRKTLSDKLLREAPVAFLAYDLLEKDSEDWRARPMHERRTAMLETLVGMPPAIQSSPLALGPDQDNWQARARVRERARELGVEGLMLKHRDSPYRVGRVRGDWWKWKIEPLTIDAVLVYAQAGHGRRSNLYTDYTFAVHDGDALVPIAKAYSGLDQEEIETLDRWIRRNTIERFGPVRSVTPEHVFEIAFEGINPSPRHKSGVALRFPRIKRWRHDLSIKDAEQLCDVKRLLPE
jgi:DNA ligase-1